MRHRVRRALNSPALALFLVAPFVGEVISTSTPLQSFPVTFWINAGLYGSAALVIREFVRRRDLGAVGVLVLGAAYGVFEEALCLRTWFAPHFLNSPAEAAYSRVHGANLLLAVHLTVFHAVISIWTSITVVELSYPDGRNRPWAGRRGLAAAGVSLAGILALTLSSDSFYPLPGPVTYAASVVCFLLLVALALALPPGARRGARASLPPRSLAPLAAVATSANFAAVWILPHTGVPWPAAILISIVPVAGPLAILARRPIDDDRGRMSVVLGLLAPLVAFDVVLGFAGGRPDLFVTAAITTGGLFWLRRRVVKRGFIDGLGEGLTRMRDPA